MKIPSNVIVSKILERWLKEIFVIILNEPLNTAHKKIKDKYKVFIPVPFLIRMYDALYNNRTMVFSKRLEAVKGIEADNRTHSFTKYKNDLKEEASKRVANFIYEHMKKADKI